MVQVIYAIDPANPLVRYNKVLVGRLVDVFIDTAQKTEGLQSGRLSDSGAHFRKEIVMKEITLTFSAAEITLLLRLVGTALADTRVEVHRTHLTPEFRDGLKEEENVLRALLAKLQEQS